MSDTPDPYTSPGGNSDQPSPDPGRQPHGEPAQPPPPPGQPYQSQPYSSEPHSSQSQQYPSQSQQYPSQSQQYPGQSYPGQPTYPASYSGYGQQRTTDGFAIGSLVSGIAGVTVVPFVGSIVAVVLGIVGLNRIKTSGQEGRGLAIAGIVLGGVGIVLGIVLVVILIAVFAAIGPGEWTYYRDIGSVSWAV